MIDEAVVQRVLTAALRTGGDFAEVFAEDRRSSSARLDDGKVEELTSGRDRGAGIRVVRGETTGFAHTSDLTESGLRLAAEAAGAAARGGGQGVREVALTRRPPERPREAQVLPQDVPKAHKVELLRRAEDAARSLEASIRQVAVSYGDSRRQFLVANSDGLMAGDDQVRTRLGVSCVAGANGVLQTGYETTGGTVGFELYDRVAVEDVARWAARVAVGVLTDYMWDMLRARKDGRESSGNGRRQSYQHLPMVRMTNTYVLAGVEDPDEIIRQTPYGIYCVQMGGGQVDTASGDFVFGMTEAYLIENGHITAPLRAANLIGNGPEVLRAIDAVGNDFDTWAGTCGKDGQGVPVSSGQPTLRVAAMTVGGTGG